MKQELIEKYKDSLLNIYTKDQLKDCPYDYILVFKDYKEEIIDNILYTNYQSFFEHKYLKLPIVPTRKPKKLLTYQEGLQLLSKIHYGTLSITDEIPYAIGLSHFIHDGHLYFHSGYKGHKLIGIDKPACYYVIEDLGINEDAFTQNFQSVLVYGILKEVKHNKEALLNALMLNLTPGKQKVLNQAVIENTIVLELTIDHLDVKRHFH